MGMTVCIVNEWSDTDWSLVCNLLNTEAHRLESELNAGNGSAFARSLMAARANRFREMSNDIISKLVTVESQEGAK